MNKLIERIGFLEIAILQLKEENARLKVENAKLQEENAKLKERLNKNSKKQF